jgi:hypothetical protein
MRHRRWGAYPRISPGSCYPCYHHHVHPFHLVHPFLHHLVHLLVLLDPFLLVHLGHPCRKTSSRAWLLRQIWQLRAFLGSWLE